ncbi:MAG TPA: heavy metal-binding domain-containing protein [Thermoanaerobaculia bacterium]|nr:heavy metal-binding domain-containing protein [Thermoanaerobaculia bacterium]
MRRHTRTVTCGALIATALLSGACRGEKKSADAGAAHQHGTSTTATAMDHSAHTSTDPHAGMNHGGSATDGAMDHSAHGSGAAVDHAAMGHGTAADPHAAHRASGGASDQSSMDHSKMDHSKMDHAAMGHAAPQAASHGNAHAQHGPSTRGGGAHAQHGAATRGGNSHAQHGNTDAQHSASQHAQHNANRPAPADPHAQHGTAAPRDAHAGHGAHGAAASTAPVMTTAPRSSTELQRVQPAATLRPDAFDAPAPAAISEARKATQGGGHEGHATRGITPGQDQANPPTPMPATRDRSNTPASGVEHEHHAEPNAQTRGAAQSNEAVVYYCPMDPEVTSARPGSCHKCGMSLVKKD